MTIFKYYKDGKFAYCSKCNRRVNRIYSRQEKSGKFIGFAWYCKKCNIFSLDNDILER